MRSILFLLLFIMSHSTSQATERTGCDLRWNKVLKGIAYVESKNNPKAVSGDQVGLLQIRPIMVRDCNRILKKRGSKKRFSLNDRYSPSKSKEMFVIYQSHYNPKGNIERAIRLWNGGNGYSVSATQSYYIKVKKAMK